MNYIKANFKFHVGESIHTTDNKNGIVIALPVPPKFDKYCVLFPFIKKENGQFQWNRIPTNELEKGWTDHDDILDKKNVVDFEATPNCNLLSYDKVPFTKASIMITIHDFIIANCDVCVELEKQDCIKISIYVDRLSTGEYFMLDDSGSRIKLDVLEIPYDFHQVKFQLLVDPSVEVNGLEGIQKYVEYIKMGGFLI